MNSGRWFVVGLCALGLTAGLVAWWVRLSSTRQSLEFWGPVGARLLVEQADLAVGDWPDGDWQELGEAKGLVHMQHFLALDRSFDWTDRPQAEAIDWRWRFRLHDDQREVFFAVSKDCQTMGRQDPEGEFLATASCGPISHSLEAYFRAIGLLEENKAEPAAR